MTVTTIRTATVELPIAERVDTITGPPSTSSVLVWVDDDEGQAGESHLWVTGRENLATYEAAVRALARHVVGREPDDVEGVKGAIWGDLRHSTGTGGVAVSAASVIECALWDLRGKRAGRPVSDLIGPRTRDRVIAGAGGSLWLLASFEDLVAGAEALATQGHRAVKMRAGIFGVEEDSRRIHAVRDVVGPDVDLAVDCLQTMNFDHALALGHATEDVGLAWLEDPLDVRDIDGHARLAAALETPVATGEHAYGVHGVRAILDAEAADILLVDLVRVGGVSDFIEATDLAATRGVDVVTHCSPEQSLQIAATRSIRFEHVDWWAPLYSEAIEFEDGYALIPDRPGFGFTFAPDIVERFGAA